jgi:peptidoglycan/LPS O-acetylase OafA/YrhL
MRIGGALFDRSIGQQFISNVAFKADLGRGRELGLDVVRGLAILLAMGYHINQVDAGRFANLLLAPGARIGWTGVDLFFVLSGFLIGGLILKEANLTGGFNYKRFLLRRILRLWPTLYTFLLAMLFMGFPARDFFWQISLHVQGYVPIKSATHLWSLAVEEQFYLLLALGFPLLSLGLGWRRTLPWVLVAIMVICPILRALAPAAGYNPTQIYILTHFRIDTLAGGVFLAFIVSERPDLFERLRRVRLLWIAVAILGVVFLWMVSRGSRLGQVAGYSISWITSAALLILLYKASLAGRWRRPALVLGFLGQVSYPLYLWHVGVMKVGKEYLPKLIGKDQVLLQTILIYAGAIAVAFTVTILLERPIMRLRDKVFPAPRKAVTPEVAMTAASEPASAAAGAFEVRLSVKSERQRPPGGRSQS